mmetsp:Transcript_49457/g.153542  ORF Transcript_49457/g.153542 Transcript_49457/m.153542 type:complete len:250 (+) Transcript_49457:1393-2142(+)
MAQSTAAQSSSRCSSCTPSSLWVWRTVPTAATSTTRRAPSWPMWTALRPRPLCSTCCSVARRRPRREIRDTSARMRPRTLTAWRPRSCASLMAPWVSGRSSWSMYPTRGCISAPLPGPRTGPRTPLPETCLGMGSAPCWSRAAAPAAPAAAAARRRRRSGAPRRRRGGASSRRAAAAAAPRTEGRAQWPTRGPSSSRALRTWGPPRTACPRCGARRPSRGSRECGSPRSSWRARAPWSGWSRWRRPAPC